MCESGALLTLICNCSPEMPITLSAGLTSSVGPGAVGKSCLMVEQRKSAGLSPLHSYHWYAYTSCSSSWVDPAFQQQVRHQVRQQLKSAAQTPGQERPVVSIEWIAFVWDVRRVQIVLMRITRAGSHFHYVEPGTVHRDLAGQSCVER